jgi:hypothetical protein
MDFDSGEFLQELYHDRGTSLADERRLGWPELERAFVPCLSGSRALFTFLSGVDRMVIRSVC